MKRRGREGGRDELQGGVQHVAQRDHEEGVCQGGRLRGGGECRVSGRGGSVQQESGQLVDDVGEGGEGECGIVRMATQRRRRWRGQRGTIREQRRRHPRGGWVEC